jgi:hypothetical protein
VVWAVAKGSLRNKAILVPAALVISAFAPWAITPLLMAGGLYLCYEGVEKLAHKFLYPKEEIAAERAPLVQALVDPSIDVVALEKTKIKGAIRTDFILSAEIIVITLGAVAAATFVTQVGVLIGIALLMTVGVYGSVAGIVKLDDAGLALSVAVGESRWSAFQRVAGRAILRAAPWLMKSLSVAGTVAMFLVGGGILVHGVPPLDHAIEDAVEGAGGAVAALAPMTADLLIGVLAGVLVLLLVQGAKAIRLRLA